MKILGLAPDRQLGTSPSVLLNAYYHKKHEYIYIWFRGGDLNSFRDNKHFYEVNGVGHSCARHWGHPSQC